MDDEVHQRLADLARDIEYTYDLTPGAGMAMLRLALVGEVPPFRVSGPPVPPVNVVRRSLPDTACARCWAPLAGHGRRHSLRGLVRVWWANRWRR